MIGKNPDPTKLAARLRELARAVAEHRMGEFTMRVPAEPERDADIVLMDAAELLEKWRDWFADNAGNLANHRIGGYYFIEPDNLSRASDTQ